MLDPLARLGRRGYEVTLLDVEQHGSPRAGWLDPQKVADAIRDDTCLVSVMLANNEIGVIQPLAEIAAICKARRAAALRRHAGRRQDSGRCRRARRRSDELHRPQDLRPERNRRAVTCGGAIRSCGSSRRSPAAASKKAGAAARSTCRASSVSRRHSNSASTSCRANRNGWRTCAINWLPTSSSD